MNVVVLIDGREAIPVRAIPFVTASRLSPDTLVDLLIPVSKFPDPMQPEALRLDKGTQSWSTFDCLQWDGIRHRLQRLARELNPKKKPDHRTQARPVAGYAASRAVEVEELTVQFRASLARGTNCAS